MSDGTSGPKPWDLERYRGVKERPDYQVEWDRDRDLVLDDSYRTGRARPIYAFDGPSLFWLALRNVVLTILTLGIFRFWMITNLRRHYWHGVRIQGDPFEYTGNGLEMLLGFLVAMVVLALYLAAVNIGLAFLGISALSGSPWAADLTVLAALPLIFFAEYRARVYILARTKWRGIRFGLGKGAGGYVLRSLLLWVLTIATAGLMYPYKQFKLSKYVTDRAWYGNMKFEQGGSWAGLFANWVWIYIVIGMMALAFWGIAADKGNPSTALIGTVIIGVGWFALLVMFMRYQIVTFRYLWDHRSLGDTTFSCDLSSAQVLKIYVFGSLGVLVFTILACLIMLALTGVMAYIVAPDEQMRIWMRFRQLNAIAEYKPILVMLGLTVVVAVSVSQAFTHIFVTQPVLQRKAESMAINNVQVLSLSRQREHDAAAEAGGFADALGVDIGAGF